MKFLRQLIFSSAVVIGLSVGVSAQKDDQKKPPKNPPVVTPADKDKPRDTRPRDNGGDKGRGGKKPGYGELVGLAPQRFDLV